MSKSLGNFIDLTKLREIIAPIRWMPCDTICCAPPRSAAISIGRTADFLKSFNELKNVVGNCLNRTIKMIDRYRAGILPAAGDLQTNRPRSARPWREVAFATRLRVRPNRLAAMRGIARATGQA